MDCRWKGLLGYSVPSGADTSVLELTEALPLLCGPSQVTQPLWALISSCATREDICSLIILFLCLHWDAVFPVSCCSKMPSTQRALTQMLSGTPSARKPSFQGLPVPPTSRCPTPAPGWGSAPTPGFAWLREKTRTADSVEGDVDQDSGGHFPVSLAELAPCAQLYFGRHLACVTLQRPSGTKGQNLLEEW